MRTSRRAIPLGAVVLTLAAPAGASAATFCVHRPDGCVGTDAATLQAALDAARANGSGRDTIRIGIGLFSDGPAVNEAGSPVDIVGIASNKTAIRSNSVSGGLILLDIREPTSTIADLRVHHATAAPTATGIKLAGEANRVMVTNQGIVGQFDAIQMVGAVASLDDSSVSLVYPDNVQNRAVFVATGADAVISDSYLEGTVGVSTQGDATVVRTRVYATQGVVAGGGTRVVVRDSEIRTPGPMASNFQKAALAAAGNGNTSLEVDRVTAYAKDGLGYGVWGVPNGGAGNNVSIELDGSVLDGYQLAVRLVEGSGSNAALAVGRSAYDLTSTSLDPGVSYTTGTGMIDLRPLDPGFRDADGGDLALRYDSPLVDAGDPAFQPFLGFDVRLLLRVRDGDASGPPSVVDVGAHEYQRLVPNPDAQALPATATTGQSIAFDASDSSDPDEDPLTFAWSFDDGAVATGESVEHAFATAGQHSATVTVTDVTGLSEDATVVVDVAALAGPTPPGGGQGPGGSANVAPRLTGLSVAPSRFRVGGRARARARARRSVTRRVATGTTIRYTLSEAARVTFTVERAAAGRRVGRACARPARANRGRRACTRWLSAGSFGVDGEQGANAARFVGRIGRRTLPPGRYRLRARARDAGGLPSSTVTSRAFTVLR